MAPEPLDLSGTVESSTAALVTRYAEAEQRLITGSAVLIGQYLNSGSVQDGAVLQQALRLVAVVLLGPWVARWIIRTARP